MAKVREVLKHVRVETADRQRKCHRRSTHSIGRGQRCLAIYDSTTSARKNYCVECARAILDRARIDLQGIEGELYGRHHSTTAPSPHP